MGSSFTEYNGFGFWARDANVEIWLALLVHQFDRQPRLSASQSKLRNDFTEQATIGAIGCVSPGLDEHLTSDLQPWLLETSLSALSELKKQENPLPTEWINPLFEMQGSFLTMPYCCKVGIKAEGCLDYANKWIALLSAEFELHETAWIGDIHQAGVRCYPKPD